MSHTEQAILGAILPQTPQTGYDYKWVMHAFLK